MNCIVLKDKDSVIRQEDFPGCRVISIDIGYGADIDTSIHAFCSSLDDDCRVICIPLCFGPVFAEYLGLRLTAHILCSTSSLRCAYIGIYGTEAHESLLDSEFYSVLRFRTVTLIDFSKEEIWKYLSWADGQPPMDITAEEIERLALSLPGNMYDQHSVANVWGIYRLCELEGVDPEELLSLGASRVRPSSIYLKWLVAKGRKSELVDERVLTVRREYGSRLPGLKVVRKIDLDKIKRK